MASRGICGALRVRAELVYGRGIIVGHNAVAALMQRAGLQGIPNRRVRFRPPGIATAADLVDRRFARTEPDQLWVTDITEHRTREGKIYCCVVLDVWSRRVVGWSIDSAPTAALATNALGMAISNRRPAGGGIIHPDQGVQFTSWAFIDRAKRSGLLPSMGSVGDAFDNAVIESFWVACRPNCLTAGDGQPAPSWRTRSSTTSRCSTTGAAGIPRSACSPRPSSSCNTQPDQSHSPSPDSSNTTPPKPGHIKVSGKARQAPPLRGLRMLTAMNKATAQSDQHLTRDPTTALRTSWLR